MPPIQILFLGTGTSHGIPMIGCSCTTCTSNDPHNQRLRTSVLLTIGSTAILIDTSIDLRQQALRYGIRKVDAALFTHHHVDHIFGLDETRSFNRLQKKRLPCYGSPYTIEQLKQVYSYIFDYPDIPGGIPMIDLIPVEQEFEVEGIKILPIEIFHGKQMIYAYRIGSFVYATDCSAIPDPSWKCFENADILVLDCLRFRTHPTHFSFDEAVAAAQRIGARQTYFIHMSHDIEHEEASKKLPGNIAFAYDGLQIECQKIIV